MAAIIVDCALCVLFVCMEFYGPVNTINVIPSQ